MPTWPPRAWRPGEVKIMQHKIKVTSAGKLIPLDDGDVDEMLFFQEVFGFEAKSGGWVREGDRVFYL